MQRDREVITIAGLASKSANLASFQRIAQEIADGGRISHIDGAHLEEGTLTSSGPARQTAEIYQIIDTRPDTEFLILSQSLGAIAALNALEHYSEGSIRAISLSPPLASPSTLIRHPRLLGRMRIENGALTVPSFSYAANEPLSLGKPEKTVPVTVPPTLFDEIDAMSSSYEARTRRALAADRLHIVVPSDDWNAALAPSAANLPNVTTLPGPHSFFTDEATLDSNARAIAALLDV